MKVETQGEYWQRVAASAARRAEMDAVLSDPAPGLERNPKRLRAQLDALHGPARRMTAPPWAPAPRRPAPAAAVVRNTARQARRVRVAGLEFTLDAGHSVVGTPRLVRERGRDTIVARIRDAHGRELEHHELTAEEKEAVYGTNTLRERRDVNYSVRG